MKQLNQQIEEITANVWAECQWAESVEECNQLIEKGKQKVAAFLKSELTHGVAVIVVGGTHKGRTGIYNKPCSSLFPDSCLVHLDLCLGQRVQERNIVIKYEFLETI